MESSDLRKVPGSVKAGGAILGVGGLAALIWKYHDQAAALLIILIGVVVVIALVLAFSKVGALKTKSNAKSFRDDLGSKLRSTPGGVTDADGRAKLDDLRRSLQGGIDKLQATGKNLYVLPWYLVVGEPGSGKTKAISAAGIALPGFQDAMQGAGGTVNMNWWFTNSGIVLDTAGRLMLPEVNTGDNPEWDEFLRTLNRRRPNCPINGLILAIPADALITDTAVEIDRKAGDIAYQFNKLQVTLGIRFPVFVLITKSDKILGFREFFESVNQPDEQAQLLGWSNPEKLDDPFKPELVEEHLTKVHEQLVRRRARLIQDPVHTDDPGGRRIDQIDALYELPEALVGLAPRLRRYLEPIFTVGPLSARPLFLRGIYFTSSLQTGEAVDAAMSAIMGADIAKSHTGGIVSEKPYFLKHVFQEKVFKEKGLVTRTSNVGVLKKRRKMAVLGAGIASVLALTGFTWYSRSQLDKDMVNHVTVWEGVQKWGEPKEQEVVGIDDGHYRGQKTSARDSKMTLLGLHTAARQEIPSEVHVPVVFKPVAKLSDDLDTKRRDAYAAFFAGKVLSPIITRARDLLSNSSSSDWKPAGTDALRQLIMLDARRPLVVPGKESFDLDKLVPYTLADENDLAAWKHDSATWKDNLNWVYAPRPDGGGAAWPPEDLAKREFLGTAITKGTRNFIEDTIARSEKAKAQQKLVQVVADKLDALDEAERGLLDLKKKIVKAGGEKWATAQASVTEWKDQKPKVDNAKKELDTALAGLEKSGAWKQASATEPGLAAFYQDIVQGSIKRQLADYDSLLDAIPSDTAGDTALADARAQLDNAKLAAEKERDAAKKDTFAEKLARHEKVMLCRLPGDDPQQRFYEVQSEIVDIADGALPPETGPAQVPADFGAAYDAINTEVDDATNKLGRARDVVAKDGREAQLCDLAEVLTKTVSGPRRLSQLLEVAIANAPTTKEEWIAYLKTVKADSTPIIIPLTVGIDKTFPEIANDPRRFKGVEDEWQTVLGRAHLKEIHWPGVMDWADLSKTAKLKNKGEEDLHAQFVQYWEEDYKSAWAVRQGDKALPWQEFQRTLITMNVEAVDASIKAFVDMQSLALGKRNIGNPDPRLVEKVRLRLDNWGKLPEDPADARVVLLGMSDAARAEKYLLVPGQDVQATPSAYEGYWTNVFVAALDCLGRSAAASSRTAFDKLWASYHRFPLTAPDATKETRDALDELSPKELAESLELIQRVWGRWQAKAVAPVGSQGGTPANMEIFLMALRQLNGDNGLPNDDPVKLEWAHSLRRLQPWLIALRDNKLNCRFSFARMGVASDNLSNYYFYGEVDVGPKRKPIVAAGGVSVFDLRFSVAGVNFDPNDGLVVPPTGPISLGLQNALAGPVTKSIDVGRGSYPQLRLMLEVGKEKKDRTVRADGKNVYHVTFRTPLQPDGPEYSIDYRVTLTNALIDEDVPVELWK